MDRFRAEALQVYLTAVIVCSVVSGQQGPYMAVFTANLHPRPAEHPAQYDFTPINRGNNLDESTFRINVPRDALYLGMLTVGTQQWTGMDFFYYESAEIAFTCYRHAQPHTVLGHNTYSRDMILWIRTGKILDTRSAFNTYSRPTGLLTSWGTVSLPSSGNDIAFTVARTSPFSAGKMFYDAVRFNIGNGWQSAHNRFVAPRSGTYFFSFSVTAEARVQMHLKLMVNNIEQVNIFRMSTEHNRDPAGRSALLPLSLGDQVELETEYPGWSNNANIVIFSGFLYQPLSQRYAWGAYRTSSWEPDSDQVPYDQVLVNEGSVWQNNYVNCPTSGVYYVYISAGLMPNTLVELTIMKNAEPMGKLLRDDIAHNGIDTFGRSMLIECSEGDQLWVNAAPGTELYSDLNKQTSFCGFYVNP